MRKAFLLLGACDVSNWVCANISVHNSAYLFDTRLIKGLGAQELVGTLR